MAFEFIDSLGFATVLAITILCFLAGLWAKNNRQIDDKNIPVICGVVGLVLGIVGLLIHMPDFPASDYITAAAVGVASGLAATGFHQAVKQRTPEPVNVNIDYKEGYMNLLDERQPLLEKMAKLEQENAELRALIPDEEEGGENDGEGN